MIKLLTAIIPALLIVAVAILSVQNATLIPLTFFSFTTIALPVGIWVAFAFSIGMIGTALLISLFGIGKRANSNRF